MEDKIRCFVALDLSRQARNYIKEVQKLIKKNNLFTGKFTEPENLHLTLKFLGEIDKEKIAEVKKRLREIRFDSFEAKLGEVGVFSSKYSSYVRVIWIKLIGCDKLQKEIDNALEGLFEKEHRFMSHITIVRVKKVGHRKGFLDYITNMKVKEIKFNVDRFFLKKSELFSEGPIYCDLEEYNLK